MRIIVTAMPEELAPILTIKQKKFQTLLTGIGKVNAASRLTAFLEHNKVDQIINIGYAGASKEYNFGDILIARELQYHDVDVVSFGYEAGQVPGEPAVFYPDQALFKRAKAVLTQAKTCKLYTGDSFVTSTSRPYSAYDMEATSLAQVASHYDIAFLAIKVVSDHVGVKEQIIAYNQKDTQLLQQNIYAAIDALVHNE